jgi:hypothetical protein
VGLLDLRSGLVWFAGWKALHADGSLQFLNAMKLAQTSGTTIVVFLSRHLTKRLIDPDVCVLLKCVLPLSHSYKGRLLTKFSLPPVSSSVPLDNGASVRMFLQGQDLCAPVTWCNEISRKIWPWLSSVSIEEWQEWQGDALQHRVAW